MHTGRHTTPLPHSGTPPGQVQAGQVLVVQAQWWEKLPAPFPPLCGLMAGILLGFSSAWGWPLALLGLLLALVARRLWLIPLVLLAGGLGYLREQA